MNRRELEKEINRKLPSGDALLIETERVVDKLDELVGKPDPIFPEIPETDFSETNSLLAQIAAKETPPVVFPEVQRVEVTNFPSLPPVVVPAPQVKVDAPIVNVEAPQVSVDTEKFVEAVNTLAPLLQGIAAKLDIPKSSKTSLVDARGKEIDLVKLLNERPMYIGGGSADHTKNAGGVIINPATEETLQAVATAIGNISGGTVASTIATGAVAISTTAQIVASNLATRQVTLINTSDTDTLYIGPSGVSTSNGIPVIPYGAITLETTAAIHGVSNGGAIDVRYITYA
jgi:hypothetical protein